MGSYDTGKSDVCKWIRERYSPESTILDVGACDGKWRKLLPEYTMDAVEIFDRYARNLKDYRNVFIMDIFECQYDWYDLVIFGDVIEHMTIERAQTVLEYAKQHCDDMIVAVPFMYEQGIVDGNIWQMHIQDDLTPEKFDKRYPGFEKLFYLSPDYCYYHLATFLGEREDNE